MKRTHCPKGEVVFIGGRRVRWSQSKRGGLNFYTDDDCPVVVGEASEVVDCREAQFSSADAEELADLRKVHGDHIGRPVRVPKKVRMG